MAINFSHCESAATALKRGKFFGKDCTRAFDQCELHYKCYIIEN